MITVINTEASKRKFGWSALQPMVHGQHLTLHLTHPSAKPERGKITHHSTSLDPAPSPTDRAHGRNHTTIEEYSVFSIHNHSSLGLLHNSASSDNFSHSFYTIMPKPQLSITSCTAAEHVDHVHYGADVMNCDTCGMKNRHAQALRLLERIAGKPHGSFSTRTPKKKQKNKAIVPTDVSSGNENVIDLVSPERDSSQFVPARIPKAEPAMSHLESDIEAETVAVKSEKGSAGSCTETFGNHWQANRHVVNADRKRGQEHRTKKPSTIPSKFALSQKRPPAPATATKPPIRLNVLIVWEGASLTTCQNMK